MGFSTAQKVGIAMMVGSVAAVCLLMLLILVGLDGVRGWWSGGMDLVFELADGIRESLFGVE